MVDPAIWPWRGMMFCHLISDTNLHELHSFARWIGAPVRAFGGDHYDISERMRAIAIEEGAIEVSSRQIVHSLYNAGLRQRPNQGSHQGSHQGSIGGFGQTKPTNFVPFAEAHLPDPRIG